jgi:hypothetical protein
MLNAFAHWFCQTALWVWFIKNVMAKFTFRLAAYPEFPIHKQLDIVAAIAASELQAGGPGRSLYTFTETDRESLASKVIRWTLKQRCSHAGIILPGSTPAQYRIFHMKSTGSHYEPMVDLLKECDVFGVHRYNIPDDKVELLKRRLQFLLDNRDKLGYDFEGEVESTIDWSRIDPELMSGRHPNLKKNVPIYCSELVRVVLKGIVDLPTMNEHGRQVFSPDDVRKYQHVELFMFDPPVRKHGLLWWLIILSVLPFLLLASLLK